MAIVHHLTYARKLFQLKTLYNKIVFDGDVDVTLVGMEQLVINVNNFVNMIINIIFEFLYS